MKIGLTIRFIIAVTFLIVVTSVSLGYYFIRNLQNTFLEQMIKRGETLSRNFAYNSTYAVLLMDESPAITISLFYRLFDGVMKEKDVLYVSVFDKEGVSISQKNYTDYSFPETEERMYTKSILETKGLNKRRFSIAPKKNASSAAATIPVFDIAYPIFSEEKAPAPDAGDTVDQHPALASGQAGATADAAGEMIGFVRLGISLEPVRHELAHIRTGTMWITLLVVMVSSIITLLLIRVITQPINQLAAAARAIANGDLDINMDMKPRNDEIGELFQAFRHMLRQIGDYEIEVEEYSHKLEQKVEQRTIELKEIQEQLLQAEKLAAIGQLAAGVAHELNNPVGGIMGYAQYIKGLIEKSGRRVPENKVEDMVKYLQFIEKESQRCKTIVQSLLNFSRFSTADFSLFDLNTVINDTLMFLEHQFEKNNISVKKNIYTPSPKINGAANHIQQVLMNICINAIQAMPEGGIIELVTKTIRDKDDDKSGFVEISISDSGVGIPEGNMNKLFEPFFTTKETGKGTGLGLSVSYGIVRNHKGDIKVSSTPGHGTTFVLKFPAVFV